LLQRLGQRSLVKEITLNKRAACGFKNLGVGPRLTAQLGALTCRNLCPPVVMATPA
jgi:hypothetical protein